MTSFVLPCKTVINRAQTLPSPPHPPLRVGALIKSKTISDKHSLSCLIDFRALHMAYTQHFYDQRKRSSNLAPISTVNVTVNATLKDLDAQSKGLTVSQCECECECECECIITMRVYSVSVRKLTRQHIRQHVSAVSFHYPPSILDEL